MKRLFDLLLSSVVLFLLLPAIAVVAILIKLESVGPIIFVQQRVGLSGKLFAIYKFRSMTIGAADLGPYFTRDNDVRITRVGQFIRKTSFDELPQLINVLKGDMSIIGPRPDLPKQESNYSNAVWQERLSVRPGITGLAQATLRSAATLEQRTELDLEYVQKSSFAYDVRILALTFKQIITKGGN
ncbi:MAG: lipopolysaccharide/colanic/teichoic acid biosynthesis glycosyltransferase [Arenicella sp.]|jgi:lipopolysaccharide/colanic/teichoic acid biosynthesis glycosyltransferase